MIPINTYSYFFMISNVYKIKAKATQNCYNFNINKLNVFDNFIITNWLSKLLNVLLLLLHDILIDIL